MAGTKQTNLAALVYGPKDFRMENREIPEPSEGEVQISIQSCGLCATDVEILQHGGLKALKLEMPHILGHEASGIISKVGEGVQSLKVGDRVALESLRICRRCDLCKSGHYNLCRFERFGRCFARYSVLPADFCHKLAENVDFESAALAEPLSVAVRGCTRAGIQIGDNVLIIGSGPLGLAFMQTAKSLGVASVTMTDLRPMRLECAKRLGADNTLLVKDQTKPELVEEIVKAIGKKPDVTVECVGKQSTVELGMRATKIAGCLLLAGIGSSNITVPLFETLQNEIDIIGTFAYANNYPQALSFLTTGKVNMAGIVTHRFPLEKVEEAIKFFEENPKDMVKIMINCSTDKTKC